MNQLWCRKRRAIDHSTLHKILNYNNIVPILGIRKSPFSQKVENIIILRNHESV